MSNKILQMKEKDAAPIDKAWHNVLQQILVVRTFDQRNPKALERAGIVGREVQGLLDVLETYRYWKEQTK